MIWVNEGALGLGMLRHQALWVSSLGFRKLDQFFFGLRPRVLEVGVCSGFLGV